jgi:hypothetical protein
MATLFQKTPHDACQNISDKSIECGRHLVSNKQAKDFKCLKEEESSAINETILKEIAGSSRDNHWLPSYSASTIESAADVLLVGDFIEPRPTLFPGVDFRGEGPLRYPDGPVYCKSSWFNANPVMHLLKARLELAKIKSIYAETLKRHDISLSEFHDDLIGAPYHSRNFLFLASQSRKPIWPTHSITRSLRVTPILTRHCLGGAFGENLRRWVGGCL